MSDIVITTENVLYKYFVRYDRLSDLIYYDFAGLNVDTVNIYIDLYCVYHTIFSRHYKTAIISYTSFTSIMINMCAHYRQFFRNLGIRTKIFIISSYNTPEDSIKIIPEYNKVMTDKLKNKMVGEMVDLNIGLLELICPYLPDIFFIKSDFESTVVMNEIMNREQADQSIIISTDLFPSQLCALRDNVTQLWPVKTYKGDESILISRREHSQAKRDFWAGIIRKYKNSSPFEKVCSLSPSNFMLLASINRFPDRCLHAITNISKASRVISQVVGFDSIKITPQTLFDTVSAKEFTEEDKLSIIERYKTLDVEYQSIIYNNSVESNTLHYENLEDNGAIHTINDKYFANDPIDIFSL